MKRLVSLILILSLVFCFSPSAFAKVFYGDEALSEQHTSTRYEEWSKRYDIKAQNPALTDSQVGTLYNTGRLSWKDDTALVYFEGFGTFEIPAETTTEEAHELITSGKLTTSDGTRYEFDAENKKAIDVTPKLLKLDSGAYEDLLSAANILNTCVNDLGAALTGSSDTDPAELYLKLWAANHALYEQVISLAPEGK